jgi:hypothetical protein
MIKLKNNTPSFFKVEEREKRGKGKNFVVAP